MNEIIYKIHGQSSLHNVGKGGADKVGAGYTALNLGMVETMEEITPEKRIQLKKNLLKSGLELLDDKKSILIEKIKNVIIEMIHHIDEIPKINYSGYLNEKLGYDYTYLSNTFSEVKGSPYSITSSCIKLKG